MSYIADNEPDRLFRLGVLLEQLQGMAAVGTQADFGELTERETRLFMYALSEMVDRCNQAYMDHHEAETDKRLAQSKEIEASALSEGGPLQ